MLRVALCLLHKLRLQEGGGRGGGGYSCSVQLGDSLSGRLPQSCLKEGSIYLVALEFTRTYCTINTYMASVSSARSESLKQNAREQYADVQVADLFPRTHSNLRRYCGRCSTKVTELMPHRGLLESIACITVSKLCISAIISSLM